MAKAIAFLVLLIIAPAVYAATYTVGGNSGWTNTGVNYDDWARPINFVVGDDLVFNFGSSHAVDEVSQTAYNGCTISNPISSSSSSPTTITLSAVGPRYFICPRSNHCSSDGQKLVVNVRAASTTPGGAPAPSTNGTTPSPPTGTPETPGTPATPSAPPPPSGAPAGIMGGRSSYMVGLSLVLAAVVGLIV